MNKDFSCNVDSCLYCIELLDNEYVLLDFFQWLDKTKINLNNDFDFIIDKFLLEKYQTFYLEKRYH